MQAVHTDITPSPCASTLQAAIEHLAPTHFHLSPFCRPSRHGAPSRCHAHARRPWLHRHPSPRPKPPPALRKSRARPHRRQLLLERTMLRPQRRHPVRPRRRTHLHRRHLRRPTKTHAFSLPRLQTTPTHARKGHYIAFPAARRLEVSAGAGGVLYPLDLGAQRDLRDFGGLSCRLQKAKEEDEGRLYVELCGSVCR